jgi:membrane associated rhomboid family serine protease
MIDTFLSTFEYAYTSVQQNMHFLLSIIGGLWVIQMLNSVSGYRLNGLGIYPRRTDGLIGIFFSPLLHGSYQHLFVNTIPSFILSALVLVFGKIFFLKVTFFIPAMSGLATWIFGRPGYHVGASSLILGYWGFLLFNAYLMRSPMSFFLAFLCIYYFGGLVFSLFPQSERVSWEGHLAGFLSGVLTSYLLFHHYILLSL